MIGTQKMTLTHASVSEALQEYINRHFKADYTWRVTKWEETPNNYGPVKTVDVQIEPWPPLGASALSEDPPSIKEPSPPTSAQLDLPAVCGHAHPQASHVTCTLKPGHSGMHTGNGGAMQWDMAR